MTEVSYAPGNWTAVASGQRWVLIDAAPDSVAIAEIWERIEAASGFSALIASLLRLGLDHLPDFALLAADGAGHHLICRGQGCATLVRSQPERVDGVGLATWREQPVPVDVEQVILGVPPADSALRLPTSAGVFLADSITITLTTSPSEPGPAESVPDQVVLTTTTPPPPALALPPVVPSPPAPEPLPAAEPPLPVAPPPTTSPSEDTDYDALFGATRNRTVEGAAIRPAADLRSPATPTAVAFPAVEPPAVEPPAVEPPAVEPLTVEPRSAQLPSPIARPAAPLNSGGLIDDVPWAVRPRSAADTATRPLLSPPVAAPPATTLASAADGDTAITMRRDSLPRLTAGLVPADRIGPTVLALLCPSSHPNPPSGSSCRLCGVPLPQHEPVEVPRPALGVLRLSTGDVITLDRGVVMGRSPSTEYDGDERPHAVKLPSGDGEISRTHLKVSLDGWHVLVTDLESTNGTLVGLPGRAPERLRPYEPLPIPPGTVVILADGIDFRFEVAE